MIDVDYFKLYNDRYGHPNGDRVLAQVAGALKSVLKRETDLVARYGGEEFVLFLPDTDPEGGQACAELARQAVQDLAIPHEGAAAGGILSISLGGTLDLAGRGRPGSSRCTGPQRCAALSGQAARPQSRLLALRSCLNTGCSRLNSYPTPSRTSFSQTPE